MRKSACSGAKLYGLERLITIRHCYSSLVKKLKCGYSLYPKVVTKKKTKIMHRIVYHGGLFPVIDMESMETVDVFLSLDEAIDEYPSAQQDLSVIRFLSCAN
jgi:hypothetical protein